MGPAPQSLRWHYDMESTLRWPWKTPPDPLHPIHRHIQTTTSFYDPEIEFQEIGVQYGIKTFWKIFGPSTCEAVIDDNGSAAYLSYNALGALTKVMT